MKFEKIFDALNLKGVSKSNSPSVILAKHIAKIVGIPLASADFETLRRQIYEASKATQNLETKMSRPQFEVLSKGLGFSDDLIYLFESKDRDLFARAILKHEFPRQYHESYASEYELKSSKPQDFLGADFATIDVFSTKQMGYAYPIVKIYLNLIRIPEVSLSYGFKSILVDLEFDDGTSITMIERLGDRGSPASLENGAKVHAERTAYAPRFKLVANGEDRPLVLDDYTPSLGKLQGIKANDEFTVTVRAEWRHDILGREDVENENSFFSQVQRAVVRRELLRSIDGKAQELTIEGQYIILVRQKVTMVENDN